MKKIIFVVQNMNMGGVQKAFINTLNALNSADTVVDVFSFSYGVLSEELPENVSIKYGKPLLRCLLTPLDEVKKNGSIVDIAFRYLLILLAKIIGVKRLYYFLFRLENNLGDYDVAVSYFNDVFVGVSNKGGNWFVSDFINAKKKVAWVHTDPEKANFDRRECLSSYEKMDQIVCVSEAVREKMVDLIPEYSSKMSVVYNYFPERNINCLSEAENVIFDSKVFNIISVGRVENGSKRMDRMVSVADKLKKLGFSDFKWRIVGDGPDYKKIQDMIFELDVQDNVELLGQKSNPYPYIKASQLLVLTSDYEGYPMVIGEALLLKTPVVTTSFAAAREMIIDYENGLICKMDEDDLAEKIISMMNEDNYKRIKDNLECNRYINKKWESQIKEII